MRDLIEIQSEWLIEIAPHYYKQNDLLDAKDQAKEKKKQQLKMPKIKK